MNSETSLKVVVPILAAVIGALGALLVSQSEIFSQGQVDLRKLNEELFLNNRIDAYVNYISAPTQEGRYRLILLGSSGVLRAMGDIYTNYCKGSSDGECENTCEANVAFVQLYQAMREDFQITSSDPTPQEVIYKARYEEIPSCIK